MYATSVGEAVTQSDNLKQHSIDLLAVKQQDYEMSQKQTDFIGTLGNAYNEFDVRLKATGETTTEGIQIRKSMTATEEELKNLVGEAGLERLKASGFSIEAIKAEQDTHSKATTAIKLELDQLKDAQNEFTDKQITAVEKRIDSLYRETEALSIWRKAQLAAYDFYAGLMDKQITFKKVVFNAMPSFMNAEKSKLGESITEDEDYRESLRGSSREGLNDDIANAKAELAKLRTEKLQRSISKYSEGNTIGGDDVDTTETPSKKKGTKGKGTASSPDNTQELFRLDIGRDTSHLFQEAKVEADKYSQSLELLNSKESILGFTTENADEKLKLMNGRILELIGQSLEYTDVANGYDSQVSNMVTSNETLNQTLKDQKVNWSELTKEEKQNLIQLNRQDVQTEQTITKLMSLSDQLRVKAQEASKSASSIGIETSKLQIDTPEKKYNKQMNTFNLDKEHETYSLGYDATNEQKRIVEIKYAVMELAEAQRRLKEIENEPNHKIEDLKKQQIEVDKLKNSVDKLTNTKTDKLKNEFSDMVVSWATEGESFGDIWKGIWKEFEKDAIYALMGIKHEGGFLSQLLGGGESGGGILGFIGGLFGGSSSKSSSGTTAKKDHGGENVISSVPKMHDGGIVDTNQLKNDEVLRTLQVGERVLSKDANKMFTSMMADFNPNVFPKTEYVPYLKNPELAKNPIINIQAQQQNQHIEELKTANQLMIQQNQMLAQMVESGGNGGTIVPIITQVSSSDVLKAIQQNPAVFQSILGEQRSRGFSR